MAAVVGLLLATMCRFGRPTVRDPFALGLAIVAFGFGVVGTYRPPAALLVVAAGILGMVLPARRGASERRRP
jgi:chromate transport protein ChrA